MKEVQIIRNFQKLTFIKGKGTSTEKSYYSYTDKSALSGKYYYRLKQVDFDGTYQYLKSVEIDLGIPRITHWNKIILIRLIPLLQ